MQMGRAGIVLAAATFLACAGSAPPAKVEAPVATEAPVPEKPEPEAIPTACDGESKLKDVTACLPPSSFAKKLCDGIYPEMALAIFAKGTPWTRVWLAGDVEAWNASGGRTHRTLLAFDEEVVVLSRHASSGIVMTGAGASYDVLRWDGTCVSIVEGELTTRRPPTPKPAAVPWNRLDEATRQALLASPKVKLARASFDKACTSAPADTKSCEKADKAFTRAVVEYVRGGAELPVPSRRP